MRSETITLETGSTETVLDITATCTQFVAGGDVGGGEHAGIGVEGVAAGENADELHVGLVGDDALDAAAEVSVTDDGGADHGGPFVGAPASGAGIMSAPRVNGAA